MLINKSAKATGLLTVAMLLTSSTMVQASENTPQNDRVVGQGNYQVIERGRDAVVVIPPRAQGPSGGALYTFSRIDSSAIGYTIGARVITNPHIYLTWYGYSSTNYDTFVKDAIKNLNASPRWTGIMKKYYSQSSTTSAKSYVGDISWANSRFFGNDTSTAASPLLQADIANIATSGWGGDSNGIYLVITAPSVYVSGYSAGTLSFCGYHGVTKSGDAYGFVGIPTNISSCQAQPDSPTGDVGIDSAISVIVHEIEEATTDPNLNAWWSRTTGNENADKCAWTWGTTTLMSSNAYFNYDWSTAGTSTKYLIQREFAIGGTPSTKTSRGVTVVSWNGACNK